MGARRGDASGGGCSVSHSVIKDKPGAPIRRAVPPGPTVTRRERVLTPGDPRRKLLFGLGFSLGMWAALVFANPPRGVVDLGPLIGLSSYAVGFFFSAYVGMHIYFFTTARTQEREWRQRYRVEHVEDIFGPLYDDIVKVIDSLEDWSYTTLEK